MAVRNYHKQHPTSPVPRRKVFLGDPANIPMPRKLDSGNFEPLPSSRYHTTTYKHPNKSKKGHGT